MRINCSIFSASAVSRDTFLTDGVSISDIGRWAQTTSSSFINISYRAYIVFVPVYATRLQISMYMS